MKTICAALLLTLAVPYPASAEILTNKSIISMNLSGLDADTIIAKVQSSGSAFDLSTSGLIELKRRGVPSAVITAMLTAQSQPATERNGTPSGRSSAQSNPQTGGVPMSRPAGIYLLVNGQMTRIEPNVSGQTKTGGFLGAALSYGIAKISTKIVLQGDSARLKTSEKTPTFYFYLPSGANHASSSSFEQQSSEPSSPNDFSLVKLEKRDGSREVRIGRGNVAGFQSGVVSKDRIDFTFQEVHPGVYAATTTNPLASGEYSFVMIGAGSASVAKLFDFSVQ